MESQHVLPQGVVLRGHDLEALAAAGAAIGVVVVEVDRYVLLLHRILQRQPVDGRARAGSGKLGVLMEDYNFNRSSITLGIKPASTRPRSDGPVQGLIPGRGKFFSLKFRFKKELRRMEKNKNNNSSNSLAFGQWPQTIKAG